MRPLTVDLLHYREHVLPSDCDAVREVVSSVGVFSTTEVDLATELVTERLAKGAKSGYSFLFAEHSKGVIGYTCFGPIPATRVAYDLYWVVVRDGYQGLGVGTRLLARTEAGIRRRRGQRIYVETSSRDPYAPARAFYAAQGYEREATLEDYYAPDDSKTIYVKIRLFADFNAGISRRQDARNRMK